MKLNPFKPFSKNAWYRAIFGEGTLEHQVVALHAKFTQSLWLDPSDTSTLFQDSEGTVPGALNQPVGLVLDRSKGLELGPELGNPTLLDKRADTDGTVTRSGGIITFVGAESGLSTGVSEEITGLTIGKTYRFAGRFRRIAGEASVWAQIQSGSGGGGSGLTQGIESSDDAWNSFTIFWQASSIDAHFTFMSGNGQAIEIDESAYSVRELPGNHASQSSTVSRPTLILDTNDKPCLSFDGSDDALTVTLSTIAAGEIIVATPTGAYWAPLACRAGVWSIGPETYEGGVGDFFSTIGGEINGLMAFDRQLSVSERSTALAWARSKCAVPNVYPAARDDNVILYTAKGQPCHMVRIPRFNLEDIDLSLGTGPHPAFVVGGVVKDAIYIGQYLGSSADGEMLSLPGVDPLVEIDHDNAVALARANGPGWHAMTDVERAAIALWCWKSGFQPRGNTAHGRSSDLITEVGVRSDGLAVTGSSQGTQGRTLAGSGPMSWRHDNTPFGIADLSGNVWEWSPGMRIVDAEIQIIENNDAAVDDADLSNTSTAWRAIDGATGALVAPGSEGTVKYAEAASGTADYTLYCVSTTAFEGMTNSTGDNPVSEPALARLQALSLFPIAPSGLGGDGFWINTSEERLSIRCGNWGTGDECGVFALDASGPRSTVATNLGIRPAFVL